MKKALILGKIFIIGLALSLQAEPGWSMDTTTTTTKIKKKKKKKEQGLDLSASFHEEMGLTAQINQYDTFNKLSRNYMHEYKTADNKELLTQNFIDATKKILLGTPPGDSPKAFISLVQVFVRQDLENSHIEKKDKERIKEMANSLTRTITIYDGEHELIPQSNRLSVPRLPIHDEPAQLTVQEILAGANPNPVFLVEKFATNQYSNMQKSCLQFLSKNNQPLIYKGKPSICYDHSTFTSHMKLTNDVYTTAIDVIVAKAYRALKTTLDNPNIDETIIKTLLNNYMDPSNKMRAIDATGASLKEGEWSDIKQYMRQCAAVYTDFYTRDFFKRQSLSASTKKLDEIIHRFKEISDLYKGLETLNEEYNKLIRKESTHIEKTVATQSGQVLGEKEVASLDSIPLLEKLKSQYAEYIKILNVFLDSIQYPQVSSTEISEIRNLYEILIGIKNIVESEYFWYFEREDKDSEKWSLELGKKPDQFTRFLFGGKDEQQIPTYRGHQLTAKAVAALSFLHKAELLGADNITILDIGFRNEESYGTTWNDIASTLMRFKANKKAWFDDWGEVDYIAYIEKDPQHQKDKFVIVYAGSNSQWDWGIDFTTGSKTILGISVHAGIGWLFNQTIATYHTTLFERLKDYYKMIPRNSKPQELEIITTGHSLGAGLAELAAFYYKTNDVLKKFTNELGITTQTVKTFTYAAPAIIAESSVSKFEDTLNKDNIYRVWVTSDPVPVISEALKIQRGFHVGRSIPLYNIMGLEKDFLDWWGPHGATYYQSFIMAADNTEYSQAYKNLIRLLNNYIRTTHLDVYKFNNRILKMVEEHLSTQKPKFPIRLHQGLAEHIIKYSPTTVKLNPYRTVGDINPHSPRYGATLSPRFVINEPTGSVDKTNELIYNRYQIIARFKVTVDGGEREVDFPIVASTKCAITDIQEYLEKRPHELKVDINTAEKFSCGVCLAKRVFVSQYMTAPSAYTGSFAPPSFHKDTLTKMFSQCVVENACSVKYLKMTGEGRHPLEQAKFILDNVGLGSEFMSKDVEFSRFQYQDDYSEGVGNKRPGVDIGQNTTGSEEKLEGQLLKDLIEKDSPALLKSIQFTPEEASNPNHICQKIILASHNTLFWNELNSLINVTELTQIFAGYYSTQDASLEELGAIFDRFSQNLIGMLKSYIQAYNAQSTFYSSSLKLAEDKMKNNLLRLKEQVLKNASWKIEEQTQALQIQ